jgi:hypothetical protein
VDAVLHQLHAAADAASVIPEGDQLLKILRTCGKRPSIGALDCLKKGLRILRASCDRKDFDLARI